MIRAGILAGLRDGTPFFVGVAEPNRAGGTRLLARRNHRAVRHLLAFVGRVEFGAVDALHAERALLHDAARTHRHFGIVNELLRLGQVLEVVEPVEEVEAETEAPAEETPAAEPKAEEAQVEEKPVEEPKAEKAPAEEKPAEEPKAEDKPEEKKED